MEFTARASGASTMSSYSFLIRIDIPRNVMYIEQHGRPTSVDFLNLKRDYLAHVVKLRAGFAIINDQREMEPYDDDAMDVAKELVQLTNEYGASRVIRIVPVDVLSTVRLSSTLVAGKSRYTSIRVASPEEAEEALDVFSDDPSD